VKSVVFLTFWSILISSRKPMWVNFG
jgi:hypothetical protein